MTIPIPDLTLSGPYFNSDGSPNAQGLQLLRVMNAVKARTGGIMSAGVSEAEATATGGATQTLAEWMADVEAATASIAAHIADTTAAHAASAISYNGGTGMSATDVEGAIDELATEKLDAASYTAADVLAKLLTVDGAGSGLDADLLDGLSSLAYGRLAVASDWTAVQTFVSTVAATHPGIFKNTTNAASVAGIRIEGDRSAPAANDEVYASFYLSDSVGNQDEFARMTARGSVVTSAGEVGQLRWSVMVGGTLLERLILSAGTGSLTPNTNDNLAVGTATLSFSDLCLASGALVNYANGNVVWTHSSGVMNLSTGVLQVGGTLVQVGGKHALPLPASAWRRQETNGAAGYSAELATNKQMIHGWAFDQSTDEFIQISIPMPKSWDEGTFTARVRWYAPSGSGNVVWGVQALCVSDDDAIDASWGTAQTVTDTLTATGDMMVTSETAAITAAGTPSEADTLWVRVYRDADNGSDTFNADAILLSVELFPVISGANDA